ncbi:MAG TPA: hypothetical protein VF144_06185 [Chitinophagaceae bacterium]
MKNKLAVFFFIASIISLNTKAQYEEEKEKIPFKQNLFTGGTVSLGFYSNTFLIGASPIFGYSATNWADVGIVVNYNYTNYRDVYVFDDRIKQQNFGGGGFVKLYPVRFLFAQAQWEYNFLRLKYIPPNNSGLEQKDKSEASSFLVGGGYTTGRQGRGGAPHYYLAILFDISNNIGSPYTDAYGRTIPIIRGGIQVPLFQGGGRNNRDY